MTSSQWTLTPLDLCLFVMRLNELKLAVVTTLGDYHIPIFYDRVISNSFQIDIHQACDSLYSMLLCINRQFP